MRTFDIGPWFLTRKPAFIAGGLSGRAYDPGDLDKLLNGRGVLSRILRPLFRLISKSWQMVLLGFLEPGRTMQLEIVLGKQAIPLGGTEI